MPTFEIEAAGKRYQVEAPDEQSAANAIKQMQGPKTEPYSGSFLPFSKDDQGNVGFDSNAGVVGAVKRSFTLPGEVAKGEVDPLSDEGNRRALEMGMVFNPVNPAVRSGDRAIPGVARATRQPSFVPPTAQQLKEAGGAGLNQTRQYGVQFASGAVRDGAMGVRGQLEADGILPVLAPKAYKILDDLQAPPANSTAPLSGIIAARQALKHAAKDFNNPTEQLAAARITKWIDEFIAAPPQGAVLEGDAGAAATAFQKGNANYAAGKRSQNLNNLEASAELRANSTYSGQNLENNLRAKAANIVDPTKPKNAAGFSKGELALIQKIADGTGGRNTLRWFGNKLGGGGGMGATAASAVYGGGAALGLGPIAGVAVGLGAPIVGYGLKKAATGATKRAFRRADEAVRKRSPLYRDAVKNAPIVPKSTVVKSMPMRGAAGVPAAMMDPTPMPQQRLLPPKQMTEEEYYNYILGGGA
jgi:hypothetical protein